MSRVVALQFRAPGAARIRLLLAKDLLVHVAGAAPSPLPGKDAALLAWLAIEGATPRERLARLLWPESDDAAARNALRQRLFQLRKLAGHDVVVGRNTLALADGIEHDLAGASELLGSADARLGGELAGWLDQQRQRRRLSARQALVERIESAEARGEPASALPFALELLALDLLSEDAHRRLIRLHYAAGDRALAVRACERCEALLCTELGVAPSAETVALMKLVERSEAAARDDSAAPIPPAAASLPASLLRPPRRIGRDAAWAALVAAAGARRVVLLAGEAGLGKSRLLSDLARRDGDAPASTLLVTARPGDGAVPYTLLSRLVRQLVDSHAVPLDAAAARDLALLLPERQERAPLRRDDDAGRLAEAVRALLAAASARGIASLAIDDLQFADGASVALLERLAGDRAFGWLVAFRPAELAGAARAWVDALEAAADVESVRLQPFDREQTRALLASLDIAGLDRFGDDARGDGGRGDGDGRDDAAASLHRRTGGNPVYVLETLKAALTPRRLDRAAPGLSPTAARREPWPAAPNVSRLIEQRLLRLSPQALSVARCAAVAAADASPALIASVLGVRPLDLADAWSALERAGVFIGDRFAHDLIAEAALASVPEAIGRTLHGDVAAWLEREGGEPARIAEHWIAAQRPLAAAPHLVAAGAAARRVGALARATELHAAAARIWREAGDRRAAFDALLSAAEAHSESAFDEGLARHLDELRTLADDESQRVWIDLLEVGLLLEAKRLDDAEQLAGEAALRARAAGVVEVEAELSWALTIVDWDRRRTDAAIGHAERALALLATLDPQSLRFGAYVTQAKLAHALGLIHGTAGRYESSERYLNQSRDIAVLGGDRQSTTWVVTQLAEIAMHRGDLQRSAALLAETGVATRSRVPSNVNLLTSGPWARLALVNGQLATALAIHEDFASFCETGSSRYAVPMLVHRARLHAFLGRRDLAVASLSRLRKRDGLLELERTMVEAASVALGALALPSDLVARCSGMDTFANRVDMLFLVLPKAEPDEALALIDADQALATAYAAHGPWLKLQATRVVVLAGAGRADEAAAAALAACDRLDDGVRCSEPLPAIAALLCPALASVDRERGRRLGLEARAWMQEAAAGLPDLWRDNYLQRAPALDGLRSCG